MNTVAIDLFCGAGGLTRGLINAGIKVKVGIDIDNDCQFAYENNNKAEFINKPVEELSGKELLQYYPRNSIKLLVGCAPCQPFSTHTFKYRKDKEINEIDNPKWFLLRHFKRLVSEIEPDIVSMENVPELINKNVFIEFVELLEKEGYFVSYSIVKCIDYGIPQNRRRLVLLASKYNNINIIKPTHSTSNYVTVNDAIANLSKLNAGEQSKKDPLHVAAQLSEKNYKRIKHSIPGGTWKNWPENLLLECHKKKSGSSYTSVYGRMEGDKPSPTITTQFYSYGTGRFGHPTQDRAISLREGAILQTFPKDYQFFDNNKKINLRKTAMLIGNAVPVKLGEVVGKSILEHLKGVK